MAHMGQYHVKRNKEREGQVGVRWCVGVEGGGGIEPVQLDAQQGNNWPWSQDARATWPKVGIQGMYRGRGAGSQRGCAWRDPICAAGRERACVCVVAVGVWGKGVASGKRETSFPHRQAVAWR